MTRYVRYGGSWVDLCPADLPGSAAALLPSLLYDDFDDVSTSAYPTVTVTASGTPHTKGSWVEAVASTTTEYDGIDVICVAATGANGVDTSTLIDVGVGSSGNEVVVVANLPFGYRNITGPIRLPVRIPAGSRIALRSQSAVTSKAIALRLVGLSTSADPSPSALVTYGANTATSRGVSLSTALANTKAAWTQITASTAVDLQAVILGVQGDGDTGISQAGSLVDIGVGGSGSETAIASNFYVGATVSESFDWYYPLTYVGHIAAGSLLSVRWARGNTANSMDAILIGVPYP